MMLVLISHTLVIRNFLINNSHPVNAILTISNRDTRTFDVERYK